MSSWCCARRTAKSLRSTGRYDVLGGLQKKAAEQGCNCRPDCVTRDVLERIESPEMRWRSWNSIARTASTGRWPVERRSSGRHIDAQAPSSRCRIRCSTAQGGARAVAVEGPQQGRGTEEEAAGGRRRRKRAASVDNGEAAGKNASREREAQQPQQQNRGGGMNPARRRRRHLSSEEREDAFRAAAAREAGAAPRTPRPPMRLLTRAASRVARRSAHRVRVVAIPRVRSRSPRFLLWPIRFRMAKSRSRAVVRRRRGSCRQGFARRYSRRARTA